MLTFFHTESCHPGRDRMKHTFSSRFYWKDLQKYVANLVRDCSTCDKCKQKTGARHGLLPLKELSEIEGEPFNVVSIDSIGL